MRDKARSSLVLLCMNCDCCVPVCSPEGNTKHSRLMNEDFHPFHRSERPSYRKQKKGSSGRSIYDQMWCMC